jgi:pimeloyl-ACP methyl ester carboxylesterase
LTVHREVSVVLLHGQPGVASDWDSVVAALPSQLRILALDRPGYGASPHPPGTFHDNAEWLLRELERADMQDVILVGHSYGGGVALSAAAAAPDRVRGLVLVASIGPGCLDGWDSLLAAPVAGPVCAVAAWWLTPWFARRRLDLIERIRNRPLAPHEHVNWAAWANARHHHGAMWRTFLTEQRSLVHGLDEVNGLLGTITAPTVVIADPADRVVPFGTAEALRDQVPGARLVLAGEGGHHLPRRAPKIIAAEIAGLAEAR